ncbi:MAG: beta-eliminating lyase-related protein [Actinobacteria bacterium]|nr:beta-eliminating lyase-related protein [Actinomycetota bacterium]MDA2976430.1 beta-eliminating lyase-related protein [Actinomycetota bacterium]
MKNKRGFASDNYAGVHPEVLARMAAVNPGHQVAYGDDTETARFQEIVKELFGKNAVGFPVFNGTGANVIALQSAVKRWEAVICVESAHIHMDEGGAPEKMGGLKLWTVSSSDGKLSVDGLRSQLFDFGFVHRAQPGVVSITQTTEMGTVYQPEEVSALADVAHEHGLLLHMDGARLSNAAAALGKGFKEFTTDVGVDLVSLGGTKIGALAAEAVVVTDITTELGAELASAMPFLRKTSMQLPSKMRFVSAQLNALFADGAKVAMENAQIANSMAAKLYEGVLEIASKHPEVSVPNRAEANAVFPILPGNVTKKIQEDFRFYIWDQVTGQVRWMCSWDTTVEDVEGLLTSLRTAVS